MGPCGVTLDVHVRRFACALLVAVATGVIAIPAAAQTLEVSVGVGALGGAAFGEQAANERVGGSGDPFRLFNTETALGTSRSVEARVGFAVSRRITLEGRAALANPELRTSISADAEGAPAITAVERVDQYLFDGGVLVRLPEWRIGDLVPFGSAGAGYLRQLHEGRTLVEEGRLYYAGGGVAYALFARGQGVVKTAGLRADARMYFITGDAALQDGVRRQGAVSGSFFVGF